jgi:hypothetical protein
MHGMIDDYGNSRGDFGGSNFEGNQADSLFMDVYAVYSGSAGSSLLKGGPSALLQGGLDTGIDTHRLLPIDSN